MNPNTPRHNSTDETIDSMTPSFQENALLNRYSSRLLTTNDTAPETLKWCLSSNTVVSTGSPFARGGTGQSTFSDLDAKLFNQIGNGTYGAIFERPGMLEIVKRPINPFGPKDNAFDLWNDFLMHTLIHETLRNVSYTNVHVPRPLQFVSESDREWWSIWRSKFDEDNQIATNLLFAERILPVPRVVRDALVDCFCPERVRDITKSSPKNKNCLIHVVLGRRKGTIRPINMVNIQNFELCIDEMELLGIDIGNLIDTLAETLAILHFGALVDAHDVEFVFGTAPTPIHNNPPTYQHLLEVARNTSIRPKADGMNFHGRIIHLWLLDFNRVSRITDINKFVEMAVYGFTGQSRAYYPRPRFRCTDHPNDQENWVRFKLAYTRSAQSFPETANSDLITMFLKGVEEYYEAKASESK